MKQYAIAFLVGWLLLVEGLFLAIDWSSFGIPSLILGGFHLHHWMVGLVLMLIGYWGLRK
jgi:hypothetical protein